MDTEAITAIIIVFIVIGLPILSFTLIHLAKIIMGGGQKNSKKNKRESSDFDEAQIMQDLHRGLSRMEKRIDALETLILDKQK